MGNIVGGALAAVIASAFASADSAVRAIPEARMELLASGSTATARAFRRVVTQRDAILARWLVARLLGIGCTIVLFSAPLRPLLSGPWAHVFPILAAILVYGISAEVLGTIARRRPEQLSLLVLRGLRAVEWIVIPLAAPLARLGALTDRWLGARVPSQHATETQLEWAIREGTKSGALPDEPADLLRNVMDFKDVIARDVMVPRARMTAIDANMPLDQAVQFVAAEGHSRFPVFSDTPDNIIGLLYAKDLFVLLRQPRATPPLRHFIRTRFMMVAETQSVASILREMRGRRLHMAIVVDEHGGTSGLVTLEDILEEIVGDIQDEFDIEAEQPLQQTPDGKLFADAAIPLADLSNHLGQDVAPESTAESLGGLIVTRSGRVPVIGTALNVDGFRLIVRDADARSVKRVEIVRVGGPLSTASS